MSAPRKIWVDYDAMAEMRAELRYLSSQAAGNQTSARIIALRAAIAKIAQEG